MLIFFFLYIIFSSIGVFISEELIHQPTITGLSVYRVNYDKFDVEEKNEILESTYLNIICPTIIKLTLITLALVKMLESDTLIEIILKVIQNNLFNKRMNTSGSDVS